MKVTAAEIAEWIGGTVDGNSSVVISGIAGLSEATTSDLSFLANPKYEPLLAGTEAGAVIVAEACNAVEGTTLIRVENPDRAFAQLAVKFAPPAVEPPEGIHATAIIDETAMIGEGASVGPHVVISAGVHIGPQAVIEAGCFIGEGVTLGYGTHLYPNVTILHRVKAGDRLIIHSGTVVGSDGFGYTTDIQPDGRVDVKKVPQLGTVEIGNDVELGANVTVDRARFGATRIGNSVKIDNLVQIAHNVQIGDYCGFAALAGIAGSAELGTRVMVWGQAGVAGHLNIGDDAQIAAHSVATKDVEPGQFVVGFPATTRREAMRPAMFAKQAPRMMRSIDALSARVADLEKKLAEGD